jgi:hypothetical protein
MGGAVGPALAAAVSNAGGLGTLALWGADIEALRRQVRETRALTSKPFAVNLNLEFPQQERLDASLQEGVPIISSCRHEVEHLADGLADGMQRDKVGLPTRIGWDLLGGQPSFHGFASAYVIAQMWLCSAFGIRRFEVSR